MFQPIHVGRALSGVDLAIPGDDTGDNISHKKRWYCELTGHYWVWKNVTDLNYVGFCHYRRYFSVDRVGAGHYATRWLKYLVNSLFAGTLLLSTGYQLWPTVQLSQETLPVSLRGLERWLATRMDQRTVIVMRPVRLCARTIRTNLFCSGVIPADLECIGTIVGRDVDMSTHFRQVLARSFFSPANMLIAPWWYFEEYSKWLFDVLRQHESRCLCTSCGRSDRVSGYLG